MTKVPTLIFSGRLKTRGSPNAKAEPYPIPVLAEPKLILKHFRRLRELKPFPMRIRLITPSRSLLSFDVKRLFAPNGAFSRFDRANGYDLDWQKLKFRG